MRPVKPKQGEIVTALASSWLVKLTMFRSYVNAWQASMRIHETMAENRIKFALRLNEMSEELSNLAKEVEKNRKAVRISVFPCRPSSYRGIHLRHRLRI